MTLKTSGLFARVYNDVLRDIMKHGHERWTFTGGRASAKSSFISLAIVLLIVSNPEYNALIVRKTARTLRRSVFEQICWAIRQLGLEGRFRIPHSSTAALPITYTRKDGCVQEIIFAGCDDPEKIKSIKTAQGYFAVLWTEEKTEFNESELQNIRISTLRGGDKFFIFESYNPPSATRHWCNIEARNEDKNRLIVHTTYKDIPPEWLGDAILHDIEQTKAVNKRAYENIYLGLATGTGQNVFENVRLEAITNEMINGFDIIYRGIDWGYYPDPFQYVACGFKDETLYIFDELRLYKHGNIEAFNELREYMNKAFYLWTGREPKEDIIGTERITADSAEPKSVADFRSFGADIRGAVKGVGSRNTGFKWLQGLKGIVIDSARCPKCADEFSLYEHEIDRKTGDILSGYPDGQADHCIDAVRYAMEHFYRKAGN